jgi:5-methylcytosine-specific restriction protein A
MPSRPPTVCPRCRNTHGERRCPHCAARRAREREPGQRTPGDERDQRTARSSRGFLRRHRVCVLCGRPSQVSDHWPRTRRELLAAGVRDPDAWHRLRPLCKPCHDRHTAATTPGGWYADLLDGRRTSSPFTD